MKNSSADVLLQTDYDLYKYSFVVEPGTEINDNIAQEQKRLKKNYEHKVGSKIQFHITIASFFAEEVMEETLVRSNTEYLQHSKKFYS
jgi:2'-5' RNA ligase